MITDLTKGKPSARLVNLALPMVLSIIFQQLYNIADSAIVGRFVGGESLYAISASYSVTMIFLAVATGSSIGITVVARKIFRGEEVHRSQDEHKYRSDRYPCRVCGIRTVRRIFERAYT